jgi:hypothetical protein
MTKVLQQGDVSECIDPYMKTQSASGLEKLQQNANQFCERLGKYRMPFVWTAINIMSLLNNSQRGEDNPSCNSGEQRCVIVFFLKSITKYITEYFYFTQLHYQLNQ